MGLAEKLASEWLDDSLEIGNIASLGGGPIIE